MPATQRSPGNGKPRASPSMGTSKASQLYARYGKKDASAPVVRPWASDASAEGAVPLSSGTNFKVTRSDTGGNPGRYGKLTERQVTMVRELGLRDLLAKKREQMVKQESAAKIADLTDNHIKLLYMIQQYTTGEGVKENELWMRRQALLVMLYEGICMQVFDYDYAPMSQQVEESVLYLNVSQDAADDLDDLREALLVKTLLLTTYKHQMTAAAQLMPSGLEVLRQLDESRDERFLMAKSDVDCLIFRDKDGEFAETSENFRLQVEFDHQLKSFILFNEAGYVQRSSVTVIENVSYVCSPYVPFCLRSGTILIDHVPENWDIAKQVADILKDERTDGNSNHSLKMKGNASTGLKELLKLGGIRATVAEWIPYGRNHLANLNQKLGSMSKVQGGIFSCDLDNQPDEIIYHNTDDETGNCLFVLDYEQSTHVNFVAEITLTEADASELQQVEQFGTHVHFDGSFFYGMVINSVMDKIYDNISFDYLTRVLVDIHQDSNVISSNLTTPYQRVMLESVFGGNSSHRPKFNLIMAEAIQPWLPLEEYLDAEEKEMELQQVIGQVQFAHVLAERTYLIIGTGGMLIVGDSDKIMQHEMTICQYVSLRARELMMDSYVSRVFQIGDILQEIRNCIMTYADDPGSLDKIRLLQSESMHEIINLQEVLHHLNISLDSPSTLLGDLRDTAADYHKETAKTPSSVTAGTLHKKPTLNLRVEKEGNSGGDYLPLKTPKAPSRVVRGGDRVLELALAEEGVFGEEGKHGEQGAPSSSSTKSKVTRFQEETITEVLDKALNIPALYSSLKLRCVDMDIHLKGNRSELDSLRYMTNYISEQEAYRLQNQMQVNTRNLEDVFRANERSSSSLEIMQVILAGTLAFDLMDRFATLYLSTEHSAFANSINEAIQIPLVWLLLNLLMWALISFSLLKFMKALANKALGVVTVRATFNIPINVGALKRMIKSKSIQSESWEREDKCNIMQCVYIDNSAVWKGEAVKIDIQYDIASRYLLKAYIQVNRGAELQTVDVENVFLEELAAHGVLYDREEGAAEQEAAGSSDASAGSSGTFGSPVVESGHIPFIPKTTKGKSGRNILLNTGSFQGTQRTTGSHAAPSKANPHTRFFNANSKVAPEGLSNTALL
eukprot:jgi/Tetstr1/427487/TSEL_017614.t2